MSRVDVSAEIPQFAGCRWIGLVTRALARLDPKAESPGESLLRCDLQVLGYAPRSQHVVEVKDRSTGRAVPYRAGFALVEHGVLVEFDGQAKYATKTTSDERRVEKQERTREGKRQYELERLDWVVARFTWPELGDLPTIRARIEHGIMRAARLRLAATSPPVETHPPS